MFLSLWGGGGTWGSVEDPGYFGADPQTLDDSDTAPVRVNILKFY